jgi:hypothetical protein
MKRKTIFRALIIVTVLILAVMATALVVLSQNQERITRWAIAKANEGFIGTLEVQSSRISVFHDFPYLDLDLQGVAFYADKEKNEKPLYEIADLYLGFNWLDILRSRFDVKLISLEGGHADVVQFANGDINLLLAKNILASEGEKTDTSLLDIKLRKLILKNFDLTVYREADSSRLAAHIGQIKLKLKMQNDLLKIDLLADGNLSLQKKGKPTFFDDKRVALDTDLDYDLAGKHLILRKTRLGLADALFGLSGRVILSDSAWCDLKIFGEKPDFSLLTAFAPKRVGESLKNFRNSGKVYFEGTISGTVSTDQQPQVDVLFGCENGFFQNIRSKTQVQDLTFTGRFSNGAGRSWATSVFELQKVSVKPDRGAFAGNVRIENFTDPKIAIALESDIDLEFLGSFLGVEGLERLRGNVILKMNFNELIDFTNPESTLVRLKQGLESELIVRNLSFTIPGYPHPIERLDLYAQMENGSVVLDTLKLKIADSDLRLTGSLNNLPALFHKQDQPIEFKVLGMSEKLNLTHLSQLEASQPPLVDEEISNFRINLAFETSVAELRHKPLPKGEFYIKDLYAKFKGYPHTLHDIHADVIITDSTFLLKDFSGEIDDSDFHFDGLLTNYNIWFDSIKTGNTRFEFDLYSEQLRLDNLLSYKGENYLPEDYRHEVAKELKLHGLLELNFQNRFRYADLLMERVEARLNVHPLKIENMRGRIHFENDYLTVENLSARLGANDLLINLNYFTGRDSTQRKRDNRFTLKSKHLNLDELLAYNPAPGKPKNHAKAFNIFEIPFTHMTFGADVKWLKHHQIEISNLKFAGRTTPTHYLFIDTLDMRIAQGSFALAGYLNGSDPKKIYFKSTTRLHQLDLDNLFIKFDNFGQDVLANNTLHGLLSGTITSTFQVHPDLTPILPSGEAQLGISILRGSLVNFAPLQAMSSFFRDRNLTNVRFDTLQNNFELRNGTLTIPPMTINSTLGFIELEGTQTLDLKMNYLIRVPLQLVTQVGFQKLFGGRRREEINPDQEDAIQFRDRDRRVRFLNVRVTGTPENFQFALGRRQRQVTADASAALPRQTN